MAPSTTWSFVTIVQPASQITPRPSASPCAVRTRIVTIDGETRWTTCGMRSKVSPAGACAAVVATIEDAGAVTVFVTVRVAPQPATATHATGTTSADSLPTRKDLPSSPEAETGRLGGGRRRNQAPLRRDDADEDERKGGGEHERGESRLGCEQRQDRGARSELQRDAAAPWA